MCFLVKVLLQKLISFYRALNELGVKTYFKQGALRNFNGPAPTGHNMEGGQIYLYDQLIKDIKTTRIEQTKNTPLKMPLNVKCGFPIRSMYYVKEFPVPLEYSKKKPSARRLTLEENDRFDSYYAYWDLVIRFVKMDTGDKITIDGLQNQLPDLKSGLFDSLGL